MKALIAEIAACGFWIAALIVAPEDAIPWYILKKQLSTE